MELIKNNIKYSIAESATKWVLTKKFDKITISYRLSKKEFKTFEDVKIYVLESKIF